MVKLQKWRGGVEIPVHGGTVKAPDQKVQKSQKNSFTIKEKAAEGLREQ